MAVKRKLGEALLTPRNDPAYSGFGARVLSNPNYILRRLGRSTKYYDEMVRDPELLAPTNIRQRAISSLTWRIAPASEDPIDLERAEQITEQIANIDNFESAIEHLNLSWAHGISGVELIGGSGDQIVDEIRTVDSWLLKYTPALVLRLITRDNLRDGIEVPQDKFIITCYGRPPYGDGIYSALYWIHLFGLDTLKDYRVFVARKADGLTVGTDSEGGTPESGNKLFDALLAAKNNSVVQLSHGQEINDLYAGRRDSQAIFEMFLDRKDRIYQRLILGTMLTTMGDGKGGSFALSKELRAVIDDYVIKPDTRRVASALNKDLIPTIATRLWPDWLADTEDKRPLPKFVFEMAEESDPAGIKTNAEAAEIKLRYLRDSAAVITEDQYYTIAGIELPEDIDPGATHEWPAKDSPGISFSAPRAKAQTYAVKTAKQMLTASRITYRSRTQTRLEALIADSIDDAGKVLREMGDHYRKAIHKAKSWSDLQDRVTKAIPDSTLDKLQKNNTKNIGRAAEIGAGLLRDRLARETDIVRNSIDISLPMTYALGDIVPEAAAQVWDEVGYYVSRITKVRLDDALIDAVDRAIRDGETLGDFTERITSALQSKGLDAIAGGYTKTLYQTNLHQAMAAGKEQQWADPAVREFFTHARYVTHPEVFPDHAPFSDMVLPIDDPRWSTLTPPLRFGCRCDKEVVSRYEIEDGSVETREPMPWSETAVGKGFGDPTNYVDNIRGLAAELGIPERS